MPWSALTVLRPPAAANGHATLCYDPARGVLLAHPEDNLQLWRWAGAGWERLGHGLLREHASATPLIAHGLGDTWVFVPRDGALEALRLSDGSARTLPAEGVTSYAHHGLAGFDAAAGRLLLHINGDDGGTTFAFDGEGLQRLDAGPYLLSGCVDPRRGQLVGVDVFNKLYAFDGAAWSVVGEVPRFTSSDLAWDPLRGALIRLVGQSDDAMVLHVEQGGAWRPTPVRMRPLMASAALCVDPERGQRISFGGQDFRASGDWSDSTWVGAEGDLVEVQERMKLRLGRHSTPGVLAGRAVVVNHSTLSVHALEASGWRALALEWRERDRPEGANLYDLSVNFGVGGGRVVMLDGDGGLWELQGDAWRRLAEGGAGPHARYARRVSVCCDADRVVVFGGWSQNDTWIFEGGAWRELETVGGPMTGIFSIAHTPKGFYLLAGPDLWRLEGERWVCVACDAAWHGRHLRYLPQRGLLMAVASTQSSWEPRLIAYSGGRWLPVGELPEEPRLVEGGSGDAELAVDPAGDRLLLLGPKGTQALALSELDLPAGELPESEVAPDAASPSAPPDLRRRAAAMVPAQGPERSAAELGVEVPAGWTLYVATPNHPASGLKGWPGLAVLVADWELCEQNGWQPWRAGGGGAELRRLERPPAQPYVLGRRGEDRLRPARFLEIEEVDPEREEEFATLPGLQRERACGSKLGGFGRFIQGDPLVPKGARFVVQLAPDLFDGAFGDFGSLYGFVKGAQGLVEVQSH